MPVYAVTPNNLVFGFFFVHLLSFIYEKNFSHCIKFTLVHIQIVVRKALDKFNVSLQVEWIMSFRANRNKWRERERERWVIFNSIHISVLKKEKAAACKKSIYYSEKKKNIRKSNDIVVEPKSWNRFNGKKWFE